MMCILNIFIQTVMTDTYRHQCQTITHFNIVIRKFYKTSNLKLIFSLFVLDSTPHKRVNLLLLLLVTTRYYNKIQDILSIVGGFWQSFSLIGFLLVTPLNKLDL
jgi:hypothetical protein